MADNTNIKKPSDQDYQKLGKAVQQVLLRDYFSVIENRRRFSTMNFLKVLMSGLGGVIGATLVLPNLIWILSFFGGVPFVERIFENTRETIKL